MSGAALAIADTSGLMLKAPSLRDGQGILTASANKEFVGAAPLWWKWILSSFLHVGQGNEGEEKSCPLPFFLRWP